MSTYTENIQKDIDGFDYDLICREIDYRVQFWDRCRLGLMKVENPQTGDDWAAWGLLTKHRATNWRRIRELRRQRYDWMKSHHRIPATSAFEVWRYDDNMTVAWCDTLNDAYAVVREKVKPWPFIGDVIVMTVYADSGDSDSIGQDVVSEAR